MGSGEGAVALYRVSMFCSRRISATLYSSVELCLAYINELENKKIKKAVFSIIWPVKEIIVTPP